MMEVNQKSAKLFNFRYVFLLPCVVPETICDHFMGLIITITKFSNLIGYQLP